MPHVIVRHSKQTLVCDMVAAAAVRLNAIILTPDLDFSDMRRFPDVRAVICLRLRWDVRVAELIRITVRLFQEAAAVIDDIDGRVLILEPGRIRVRNR